MVVKPIAKIIEAVRCHESQLLRELRCSDEWLPTIPASNLAADVSRDAVPRRWMGQPLTEMDPLNVGAVRNRHRSENAIELRLEDCSGRKRLAVPWA